MPTKSLNAQWDEEDPNRAIPDHEGKGSKMDMENELEITPATAVEINEEGRKGTSDIKHIEKLA